MRVTIISIFVTVLLIGGALVLTKDTKSPLASRDNVTVENGVQVITLDAKGGYKPRRTIAQAGLPTLIRFNTSGTFDCSASVRIPSLNVSRILPQTGETDINIGSQMEGILKGSCGMGMYPFEVEFATLDKN